MILDGLVGEQTVDLAATGGTSITFTGVWNAANTANQTRQNSFSIEIL